MVATCLALVFVPHRRYDPVAYALPTSLSCIIWNSAEFIVLCVRRDRSKGIHPGAHVGVDLLIFGGAIVSTMFMFINSNSMRNYYDASVAAYYWPTDRYLILVLGGVIALLLPIHFALFVRACAETDHRARDRRVQQLFLAFTQRAELAREDIHSTHHNPVPPREVQRFDIDMERELGLKYGNTGLFIPDREYNQKVLIDDLVRKTRLRRSSV
ncbi:hypothetical protein JX265_000790 [Neoarthrinium moseri]|uniref:Uncharacterized protein n=1 Tax=Neoarthrinium moseri TaxID=1658444 RepID=A0A9P9WWM2_9PEZI|nr:hypothetical protein JX265_000790 [Neoarthrinium moseri]